MGLEMPTWVARAWNLSLAKNDSNEKYFVPMWIVKHQTGVVHIMVKIFIIYKILPDHHCFQGHCLITSQMKRKAASDPKQ
jgi:hypothetical protein